MFEYEHDGIYFCCLKEIDREREATERELRVDNEIDFIHPNYFSYSENRNDPYDINRNDIIFDNKWYNYFMIALYGFLIIVIIGLVINYYNLEQYKPIANLDFEESEWIKINTANLQVQVSDRIISPNDPVTLFLNITNKVPLNIMIDPEFYPYIAGELGDAKHVASMTYGFEHTGTFSRLYFPTSEGLNILKVALKISYSNGTFLTYQNDTTSFDVVSNTDKLQIQQNYYLFWGVIASATIGGGTLTALYFNQKTSKEEISKLDKQNKLSEKQIRLLQKQNQDLKEQTSIQNRPWISLSTEEPVRLIKPKFEILLINYGKTVATNITAIAIVHNGKITEENFIGMLPINPKFDISPKEKFSEFITIKESILEVIDTSEDIHIGLLLKYNFEETKEGRSFFIAKWIPSTGNLIFDIKKLD